MSELLKQFLIVVFGSGAAIAIARLFFEERREARLRKNAVTYLAVRLAYLLEAYAINCASKASDNETAIEHEGHAGTFLGTVPKLDPLPESEAYPFLDTAVLSAVLDLPQQREMAEEAANFYWDMLGDQDLTHVAMGNNTILMGSRALNAAQKIRTTYKLGARDLTFGEWNIQNYFRDEIRKINEMKAREKKLEERADAEASQAGLNGA